MSPSRSPLRALAAVLIAQFLSALADNALLFAAIAWLKQHGAPTWQVPLLQACFVIAFIALAPWVGLWADGWAKKYVLFIANSIKWIGVVSLYAGLHALWAYALVGVGAALYSPAKYGILGELVDTDTLVRANAWMEGSTVVAILLGAVIGGQWADGSIDGALLGVTALYSLAALANLGIPRTAAAHTLTAASYRHAWRDFNAALRTLWRDADARFSLCGSSLFWGTGATLRLLLVAWVPLALQRDDAATPANLNALVAIGIAFGAAAAARWVSLNQVARVVPAGGLIGVWVMGLVPIHELYTAAVLLGLIGACGGFYVVPLNALLQARGQAKVGGGHTIAVQNLFENSAMLLMIGLYSTALHAGIGVMSAAMGLGALMLVGALGLGWRRT